MDCLGAVRWAVHVWWPCVLLGAIWNTVHNWGRSVRRLWSLVVCLCVVVVRSYVILCDGIVYVCEVFSRCVVWCVLVMLMVLCGVRCGLMVKCSIVLLFYCVCCLLCVVVCVWYCVVVCVRELLVYVWIDCSHWMLWSVFCGMVRDWSWVVGRVCCCGSCVNHVCITCESCVFSSVLCELCSVSYGLSCFMLVLWTVNCELCSVCCMLVLLCYILHVVCCCMLLYCWWVVLCCLSWYDGRWSCWSWHYHHRTSIKCQYQNGSHWLIGMLIK